MTDEGGRSVSQRAEGGRRERALGSTRAGAIVRGVLVLAAVVWIAMGVWSLLAGSSAPRALVGPDGWTATGDFKLDSSGSDPLAIPHMFWSDASFRFWQAMGTPDRTAHGTIQSAPFDPPPFIAVPYAGFPDEVPGNRIDIRCVGSGATYPVSRFRMNDRRATSFVALPDGFCSGKALVEAAIDGKEFISLGTPFAISRATYEAQTGMFARALTIVASWSLFLPLWLVSAFAVSRVSRGVGPVAAGMVGGAVFGMAVLAAFTIGRVPGIAFTQLAGAAVLVGALVIIYRARRWTAEFLRAIALPAGLWLAIALFYAGVVTAGDNGGGSWWINGFFTPVRWSSDNQLTFLFAESLFGGAELKNITWGPWLATDRVPLMSALLAALRVLALPPLKNGFGEIFLPTAYMMAAIVLLTAWAAVLVEIVRRLSPSRLAVVLLLAATTPFLLFNSVFAWPKLLGATYVLIAFDLLFGLSMERRRDGAVLALAALAAMAGVLTHSSNLFACLPIAFIFARTLVRQGAGALAVATVLALMLASPWFYWQAVIQPGGNALLRFALAFDFDVGNRTRPLLSAIADAYRDMSFGDWLRGKWASIALSLGIAAPDFGMPEMASNSPAGGWLGTARIYGFLSVAHALSVAGLGLLAVPVLASLRRIDATYRAFAVWSAVAGLSGVVLGLLVMLPPGITHQQPYGSLLLILAAGALALAALPVWIGVGAAIVSLAWFGTVWVWHPIVNAVAIHGSALALMAWIAAAVAWMLLASHRFGPANPEPATR